MMGASDPSQLSRLTWVRAFEGSPMQTTASEIASKLHASMTSSSERPSRTSMAKGVDENWQRTTESPPSSVRIAAELCPEN